MNMSTKKQTSRRPAAVVETAMSLDRIRGANRLNPHPKSKTAGRRLALEAKAQANLLVAANAALRELRRLDALVECRADTYLGLRDALHSLDALDGPQPPSLPPARPL
jgi:hypothetical protein